MTQARARTNTYTGHNGSVWKVAWAHPEYGQLLASCSFDMSVCVWEEKAPRAAWEKKAALVDARKSVVDIKFAPKHWGLRLVCAAQRLRTLAMLWRRQL